MAAKKNVVKEKIKEVSWSDLPGAMIGHTESTEPVEPVEPVEPKAPSSDMWTIYEAVSQRLIDNDILVNSDYPIRVEIQDDFVKDCKAMITTVPYIFEAKIHCMVAKGDDTGLRLDLLKNVVRAALLKAPLDVEKLQISILVTREEDLRVTGFRKSVLSLLMTAEEKQKEEEIGE